MKKIIPAIAIIGSVAALIVYKIKKDEQKQIIDLDQGLLSDDNVDNGDEEQAEEGPISDPLSCCMEDAKDAMSDIFGDVKDCTNDTIEKVEDFAKKTTKKASKAIEEFDKDFPNILIEEVADLKTKAKNMMDQMLKDGDVHDNERPVQHKVKFKNAEDLDNFKNTVINSGFVITKGDSDLELVVLHITPMKEEKIISNILLLANIAHANNGVYEGWTSKVTY